MMVMVVVVPGTGVLIEGFRAQAVQRRYRR